MTQVIRLDISRNVAKGELLSVLIDMPLENTIREATYANGHVDEFWAENPAVLPGVIRSEGIEQGALGGVVENEFGPMWTVGPAMPLNDAETQVLMETMRSDSQIRAICGGGGTVVNTSYALCNDYRYLV
jgi:hypothetical protein